ncbi:transcriptional regulator with XRE-family HTH domain [Streptomyces sp. LBL]|uniref:helix-turn-helix domain-containing protein n=1 Tax=Streptomyces sp. LBL TaxID=2940562 RepID=UPI002474D791|nr:helix-turn-helix transcriptional regulator [Streptomyces sp. LBL]MDH6622725.1 transcriptional regulator with XRE-family HTH domain [Streptomyces sp. LBL]
MDRRKEIREFLTTRRAKITPAQAELPAFGSDARRVPGLRREEVALLAGVSVDYYTRLERGNARGVSDNVLDNLARALQLTEAERTHLFDLVRAANATTRPRRTGRQRMRPAVQRILDAMTTPAHVWNGHFDTLAANRLGRALFSPVIQDRPLPVNHARFLFLDPRAEEFFSDWEGSANGTVAALRWQAGRNPYDKALTDLVGELSTRSEFFRTRWAAHNVRVHRNGVKKLHHPVVGDLSLPYESMALDADSGLTLVAYSAEPGSPSEEALGFLASWAAASDHEQGDQPAQGPDPRQTR